MSPKHKNSYKKASEIADIYYCYEKAVQCVKAEIDFVDDIFTKSRKRQAKTLREDFCGTMNTSCQWVKLRTKNIAYGVDIDKKVLKWAKKNNIATLESNQKKRINIINNDVISAKTKQVDICLAMNFSYWLLKERKATINYFSNIYNSLKTDGLFFLDAYGGYEAFQVLTEKTKNEEFTYIWEQETYNPIDGIAKCHIHFKFKDGSKIKKAFTYEWRVWTMPEILEMLHEANFKPTVYWEQVDENGEGNGIFLPETKGKAEAGWIAYIVAEK